MITFKILSVSDSLIEVEYFKDFKFEKETIPARFFNRIFNPKVETEEGGVSVSIPLDTTDNDAVVEYLRAYGEKAYANAKIEVVRDSDNNPILGEAGENHGIIIPDDHELTGKTF